MINTATLKSVAKRVWDVGFGLKVGSLRLAGAIDFPVPPNHNLRTTSSTTIRHYYESGLTTMLPIIVAAMHEGFEFDKNQNVLDFGCGVGRQLLHISKWYPKINLSACDVDADVITYIHKTFPRVSAYANSFDPPLRYESDSFDMVYSVSIFSHLSLTDRQKWLKELFRILVPGGLLLITINGLQSLRVSHGKELRSQFTEQHLAREGFIFDSSDNETAIQQRIENPRFGQHARGITRQYGETYYHPMRVEEYFGSEGFDLVRLLEGIVDRLQDLVVLKKRVRSDLFV
jgi:ubiquinone/menaquinone biosynthesis C-methylase UbiE